MSVIRYMNWPVSGGGGGLRDLAVVGGVGGRGRGGQQRGARAARRRAVRRRRALVRLQPRARRLRPHVRTDTSVVGFIYLLGQ